VAASTLLTVTARGKFRLAWFNASSLTAFSPSGAEKEITFAGGKDFMGCSPHIAHANCRVSFERDV
jgi:hypothetical protein